MSKNCFIGQIFFQVLRLTEPEKEKKQNRLMWLGSRTERTGSQRVADQLSPKSQHLRPKETTLAKRLVYKKPI